MEQEGAVDRPHAGARAWAGLVVLLLFYMFAFVDRQVISLLVQPIKHDLGLSDIQIGMLQGVAFAIFFAIGGLSLGWLVDRASRRWIILWGMLVWSLSSASCGVATGFGLLFLARLFVGVGEAALTPSAYSLLHDIFPRERLATALAVFSSGATVGGGVAFALGGMLIGMLPPHGVTVPFWGEMAAWRVAFLVTGLPGLLLAFLVFVVPEPPRAKIKANAEGGGERLGQFISRQRVLMSAYFCGFPCHALCAVSFIAWGPTFFLRRFDWDTHHVGLAFGVMIGVFGTLGNMLSGLVVDFAFRRGMADAHFRVPLIGLAIAFPTFAVGLMSSSPWVAAAMLAIGFAFLTSYAGPAASALQLIAPSHLRGQISAIFIVLVSIVGTGIGPVAVGVVTDAVLRDESKLGLSMIIVLGIAGAISATTMMLGLGRLRAALGPAGPVAGGRLPSPRATGDAVELASEVSRGVG